MDHVPVAQFDARQRSARRLRLDARRHNGTHRSVLDDQLDDNADVTHELGSQHLDTRFDQLLTHREGVRARPQR